MYSRNTVVEGTRRKKKKKSQGLILSHSHNLLLLTPTSDSGVSGSPSETTDFVLAS